MVGRGVNLNDVMRELGDACDTIAGLQVFRYWPGNVAAPAAVIGFPDDVEFETSYGPGSARMTVPVVVLEGAVSDRSAALRMGAYAAGAGANSIKAAIDGYGVYTALDVASVTRVEFDIFPIASVDHLAAVFEVDVVGPAD